MKSDRILDHLYGELEPEDELDLLNEVEVDDDLAGELAATRRILTAYRLAPTPPPPAGVAARALEEARAVRSQPEAGSEPVVWESDVAHTRGREEVSGELEPSFWDHAWKLAALFVFCFGLAAAIMIEPWKPAEYLRNVEMANIRPERKADPHADSGMESDASGVFLALRDGKDAEVPPEPIPGARAQAVAEPAPQPAPLPDHLDARAAADVPVAGEDGLPSLPDPEESLLAVVPPGLDRVMPPAATLPVRPAEEPARAEAVLPPPDTHAAVEVPGVEIAEAVETEPVPLADAPEGGEHPTLAMIPKEESDSLAYALPRMRRDVGADREQVEDDRTRPSTPTLPALPDTVEQATPPAIDTLRVEPPVMPRLEERVAERPSVPEASAPDGMTKPMFELSEEVARQRADLPTEPAMPPLRDVADVTAPHAETVPPAPSPRVEPLVPGMPSEAPTSGRIRPMQRVVDVKPEAKDALSDTTPSDPIPHSRRRAYSTRPLEHPPAPPLTAEPEKTESPRKDRLDDGAPKPAMDLVGRAFGDPELVEEEEDDFDQMAIKDERDAHDEVTPGGVVAWDARPRAPEGVVEGVGVARVGRPPAPTKAEEKPAAPTTGDGEVQPLDGYVALEHRDEVEDAPPLTGREDALIRLRRARIAYDLGDYDRAWEDLGGIPLQETSEEMKIEIHALRARTALQRKDYGAMDAAVRDLHPLAPLTAQALWRLRDEAMRPRPTPAPAATATEPARPLRIDPATLPMPEPPQRTGPQPFRPTTDPYERSLQQ